MLPVSLFATLFAGRTDAWGLGHGEVRRGAFDPALYGAHLRGEGSGLGIFPLLDDARVHFAAIDLDEPDFEAARTMQRLLPGTTWIESSRSGNAHVWAFFTSPIEAWIPRGIMQLAIIGAGKAHVEVFPKQDVLRDGSIGNYINLPWHGDARPILFWSSMDGEPMQPAPFAREHWLEEAMRTRNDPEDWRRRAGLLDVQPPGPREETSEFGTQPALHGCAAKIIRDRYTNPILRGHRSVVYFSVAKQLLNWNQLTTEEAWHWLQELESASPDRVPERELRRIFENARTGRYTSTGCDDPLMAPYVEATCPIAHPERTR